MAKGKYSPVFSSEKSAGATKDTFMRGTEAEFVPVTGEKYGEIIEKKPDYTSDSGSQYWYENGGVYRMSNHWGRGVASCNWKLKGYEKGDASTFADYYGGFDYMGFAKWSDFSLKESAVVFEDLSKPFFERIVEGTATLDDVSRGYVKKGGKVYTAEWDNKARTWVFTTGKK